MCILIYMYLKRCVCVYERVRVYLWLKIKDAMSLREQGDVHRTGWKEEREKENDVIIIL